LSDGQYVFASVSQRKFDREIERYRALEDVYRRRGWFLVEATFPTVVVMFAAVRATPPVVVCAVRIDFTNYDLVPPSVTFIHPFTGEPLPMNKLGFQMLRVDGPAGASPQTVTALAQQGKFRAPLLQAHDPNDIPFLCLPGIREYHNHPAHTGDSWLLHRRSGEGSLHFILEQIWASGVNPIKGQNFQIQKIQLQFAGYQLDPAYLQS